MKKCLFLAQENSFSSAEIKQMEGAFLSIYHQQYPQEKLQFLWMLSPKGYAYTERQPSNAVVVMVEVEENIDTVKREELMHLFSNYLLEEFNISPLDSVITVANSSFVNAFFEAQKRRIASPYRPWISLKMISSGLLSKLSQGFFRLRVRY